MATIILRLHPAESPDSELDGREGHEGGRGLGKVLEVLGEAAISPEPREGALNHPRGTTTKPFMSSLRLTISTRSTGTLATAVSTCQAL